MDAISHAVHHVSLCVEDLDVAKDFYVNTLGLAERPRPDGFDVPGIWLICGSQEVHLMEDGQRTPPRDAHFAFAVDDLDVAADGLESCGVDVSERIPIPGGGRQAFFHDPSGNRIELNEQTR